jgi:hypothetical protein
MPAAARQCPERRQNAMHPPLLGATRGVFMSTICSRQKVPDLIAFYCRIRDAVPRFPDAW